MMRLLWVLILTLFLHALPAKAENYALLVGVNRYPSLSQQFQLNGAVNDVNRMADFLRKSGFQSENVHVLNDDQPPEKQARRNVILKTLKQLSEHAGKEDVVFVHFAVHGSQQPVLLTKRFNEADDLDEILLPSDVRKWDGKMQRVENAIADDELDVIFRQMRQRGAFVVASFDTCHAGTMARGNSGAGQQQAERARFVPMTELGIPNQLQQLKWQTRGVRIAATRFPRTNAQTMGGFVGLYASQSDQITKEAMGKENEWYGVFSDHLIQAMSVMPKASYRQIGEHILALYRQEKRWLTSPQFEGTCLDCRLWNNKAGKPTQQWALEKQGQDWIIAAGRLHQFDVGARFTLHKDAGSEAVLGYAKVVELEADHSRLQLESNADINEVKQAQFARLRDAKFQHSIRIAMTQVDPQLQAVFDSLAKQSANSGVIWSNSMDADYKVAKDKGQPGYVCIAKIKSTQVCENDSIRLRRHGKNNEFMQAALQTAANRLSLAHRLNKIAHSFSNTSLSDKVELGLRRVNSSAHEVLDLSDSSLILKTGDKLQLSIKNHSKRALDVTILVLNNAMGIRPLFPEMPGANRIEAEGEQIVSLEVDNQTKGAEQVFVFVSDVQPLRASDFSFLEQAEIRQNETLGLGMERRRGQELDSLSYLLTERDRERGRASLPETAIKRLSWITR